jgi:hypothetical protein
VAENDTDEPIPPPIATDPEDVSWALSTAEAMWSRGDVAEAVKWLRRGAEAASEAEADDRALTLAKAAANLSSRAGRRTTSSASHPSASAAALLEATPQAAATAPSNAPSPPSARPPGSARPPLPAVTPARGITSGSGLIPRVPAPLSQRSDPPPARPASVPVRAPSVPVPVAAVEPVAASPEPPADEDPQDDPRRSQGRVRLATQPDGEPTGAAALEEDSGTLAGIGPETDAEAEEPWAPPPPSSQPPPPRMPMDATAQMPALTELNAIEVLRGRRPLKALGSASDWDAQPTKTLSGKDLADLGPPRAPVAIEHAPPSERPAPSSSRPEERKPLATTQAVRCVLWKDANGVHVAPHGTRVSAISVDVMVVALDPSADIRAWLDPTHRKSST